MPIRKSEQEWEKLGRTDPYYGVVSMDRFRDGKMDAKGKGRFFDSGREHVEFILDTIRKRLDPEFSPTRALDFGSGVDRCAIPLAEKCAEVVGTDVSESMLAEARHNCGEYGIGNIEHILADDLKPVSGKFDLIHSFIVFQHINPGKGLPIFRQMLDRLNPDGILAVQFLYHRDESSLVKLLGWLRIRVPLLHNLVNLIYGKPFRDPLMEKNCYNLNRLFRILHEHECGNVHAVFQGRGKLRSVVLLIQNRKEDVPYDSFYE